MKRSIFAAVLPAVLWSCPPALPPEPGFVVFPPYADAGADSDSGEDALCRLACENLAKMGCPESAPPGPKTCAEVCANAERYGNPLDTICVANASTPEIVRRCKPPVRCAGR